MIPDGQCFGTAFSGGVYPIFIFRFGRDIKVFDKSPVGFLNPNGDLRIDRVAKDKPTDRVLVRIPGDEFDLNCPSFGGLIFNFNRNLGSTAYQSQAKHPGQSQRTHPGGLDVNTGKIKKHGALLILFILLWTYYYATQVGTK